MAEPTQEQGIQAILGSKSAPTGGGRLLWILISVAVLIVSAGSGFVVATLLGASPPSNSSAAQAEEEPPPSQNQEFTYYELDPIIVNLNEPRLARYIRAVIVLAADPKDEKAMREVLEKRKPELRNWLTVYLAGQSLDEVRGAKGLNRVRREIQDSFNEQLWPQQRPRIHHVLLKEFAIQ